MALQPLFIRGWKQLSAYDTSPSIQYYFAKYPVLLCQVSNDTFSGHNFMVREDEYKLHSNYEF